MYIRKPFIIIILTIASFLPKNVMATPMQRPNSSIQATLIGELDTGFGVNGVVNTDFFSGSEQVWDVIVTLDGSIILAGSATDSGGDTGFGIAKYNSSGALDASFGSGGKLLMQISGSVDRATTVLPLSDGKILVGGWGGVSGSRDFIIIKLNSNGSQDTSFGINGIIQTDINNNGSDDFIASLNIDSFGRIVAVGQKDHTVAIARYMSNGDPDATFSGDGKTSFAILNNTSLWDSVIDAAIQSDNKIIIVGGKETAGSYDFALARVNENGSIDTTFHSDGFVTTTIGSGVSVIKSVVVQPDGKILVAGRGSGNTKHALARYLANGQPDTSFDVDGIALYDFNTTGGDDVASDMVLLDNGNILTIGFTETTSNVFDIVVSSFLPNGALNPEFSSDGYTVTPGTGFDMGTSFLAAAAVQTDGKIIFAGTIGTGSSANFGVARFHGLNPVTFTEHQIPGNFYYAIDTGDIDNDGDIDIVSATDNGNNLVWLEKVLNTWSSHTIKTGLIPGVGGGARDTLLADIDNDTDLDIVLASTGEDKLYWFENNGSPGNSWTEHLLAQTYDTPINISVSDLEGDGDLDIFAANLYSDNISWLENEIDPVLGNVFIERVVVSSWWGPYDLHIYDIDGDGDNDIIASSFFSYQVNWFENDGSPNAGSWPIHNIYTSNTDIPSISISDIDNDGDYDVAVIELTGTNRSIYWMENIGLPGNATNWQKNIIQSGIDWGRFIATSDLNRDGNIDIIRAHSSTAPTVSWFANLGDPVSGGWSDLLINNSNGFAQLKVDDISSDGRVDIIAAPTSGSIYWWEQKNDLPLQNTPTISDIQVFDRMPIDYSCVPENIGPTGPIIPILVSADVYFKITNPELIDTVYANIKAGGAPIYKSYPMLLSSLKTEVPDIYKYPIRIPDYRSLLRGLFEFLFELIKEKAEIYLPYEINVSDWALQNIDIPLTANIENLVLIEKNGNTHTLAPSAPIVVTTINHRPLEPSSNAGIYKIACPMSFVKLESPADILLTSNEGMRVGNTSTGVVSEIPGAFYTLPDYEHEFIIIGSPDPSEDFQIKITGTDNGTYGLSYGYLGDSSTLFTRTDYINLPTTINHNDYYINPVVPSIISIKTNSPNPTNAVGVDYLVTFSEEVKDIEISDFNITKSSGITNDSITAVTGSGSTRIVTINTGSGYGTLRLDIPDTAS
ncbi:MAG TPA: FG-GAP-like repeat-containing protein, partial [Anaerolineales bacterium]|nr:FG-GAP-like repeat-containing protein [Anaerolineales bacterium]